MKVYIGADHRGFALKGKLVDLLHAQDVAVVDCGAHKLDESDDYPQFAQNVAKKVAESEAPTSGADAVLGIAICGSGIGVCVAANKVRGIRAGTVWSAELARHIRERDNINVLCLSADYTDEQTALEIAQSFLTTPFTNLERDRRRIAQIAKIEK